MQRRLRRAAFGVCLMLGAAPCAAALDIVLTNDDGFETANIQALYRALVKAGHHVILSAPYGAQSGTSGMLAFLKPIGPTAAASPKGTLPAGSPGVGPTTLGPQQFYVDGSPAAAVLYGIDVAARRQWSRAPDLVISGPNEGNNLGVITPHSGTVGAAVTALNKGVPAVAVSAQSGNPAAAAVVAALTVKLVAALDGPQGVRLPNGVGLNVNTPAIDADHDSADDFPFVATGIGASAPAGLEFYEHLGDSPVARGYGIPANERAPGVSLERPATGAGYPDDHAPVSESNAIRARVVTVSPIQGTYAADAAARTAVAEDLRGLFATSARHLPN